MAEKSKIGWTESSWNVVAGCSKVSAGCQNCYAEKMASRLYHIERAIGGGYYRDLNGRWDGTIITIPERLEIPLHWRKPRRIFVCSMSDLFHEKVPFEFIDKVMDVINICRRHTFQILTKRPQRILEYIKHIKSFRWHSNIWLGVTCENQKTRDERVPILLETPASVRFISCEPLLSFMCLNKYFWRPIIETTPNDPLGEPVDYKPIENKPDWIIVGCESGPNRRPCKIEWVRSIVEQCKTAGVPVFVKQLELWGIKKDGQLYETTQEAKLHLGERKMKSFVTHELKDFPKDLQIRQYPKG